MIIAIPLHVDKINETNHVTLVTITSQAKCGMPRHISGVWEGDNIHFGLLWQSDCHNVRVSRFTVVFQYGSWCSVDLQLL